MSNRRAPKIVVPAVQKADTGLPPCQHVPRGGNQPFTLVHHHSWSFVQDDEVEGFETGRWLPDYGTIRHEPGANGVTKDGNAIAAINGCTNKGSIPIRPGDRRLAEPFRNYLAAFEVKGGGKLHVLAGVQYALIRGGRAAVPVPDKAWLYALRQNFVDSKIVPPMTEEYLGEKIHAREARIKLYSDQAARGNISEDVYQRKLKETQDEIEAWQAAYDEQFGSVKHAVETVAPTTINVLPEVPPEVEEAPKPKRTRRVAKKEE